MKTVFFFVMAAAISLTSCSSSDNEQEKSFTTAPVEQTKFSIS